MNKNLNKRSHTPINSKSKIKMNLIPHSKSKNLMKYINKNYTFI